MTLDELTELLKPLDDKVEVMYTDTDPAWFTAYFSFEPSEEKTEQLRNAIEGSN